MTWRLTQLTAKAKQASEFVVRSGGQYYKNQMEKNKKYVVNPPTIEKCKELSKQLFYTRLTRGRGCSAPYRAETIQGGFCD
jgi:F-type H+-transporting ATPase subunit g